MGRELMMQYFILGILLSSLFSTICLLIYDSHEKQIWEILSGGIFTWLICVFGKVIYFLNNFIKYYNLKSLLKCPDGEIRYIDFKRVDNYRSSHTEYDFAEYSMDLMDKYPKTLWTIKGFRDYPNVRYSPKIVWKDFNPIEH
jgi:hypothetical protein